MILPPGVDLATVTEPELVAAYIELGRAREDAEASANLLLNGDPLFPTFA